MEPSVIKSIPEDQPRPCHHVQQSRDDLVDER
jgi:hypothetical protein